MHQQPHTGNGVSRIIGSPLAGLLFLALALYAQTPHTQNAFFELGHDQASNFAKGNSWAYAIALELAVLYFVVRGNFQPSYIFAGVSVAMNLAYYTIHQNDMTDIASNWPRWLVSVSLPVAIAYYSHCIVGTGDVSVKAWFAQRRQWMQRKASAFRAKFHHAPEVEPAIAMSEPAPVVPLIPAQPSDAQPDIANRIVVLRANGFDDKWIATHELAEVPGTQLAEVLGVNASTISRWRKAAQTNGHSKELVA